MLLSLITPTHVVSKYLEELFESIKAQTYTNWQWILYCNGSAKSSSLPKEILSDNRVKIIEDFSGNSDVGYLKNRAFKLGDGDILVEVDHDDLLVPDCLEKLALAFKSNDCDFVSSNCAILDEGNDFIPFNPSLGWTYERYNFRERNLYSMKTFLPTSHSLAYIWYAPDHVRSWRRDFYHEIGGHNDKLSVCDDHDLLIRTYLFGRMLHVDDILYLYRTYPSNTVIIRNQQIQETTQQLFSQNIEALVDKEATLRGLKSLNLNTARFKDKGDIASDDSIIQNLNLVENDSLFKVYIKDHSSHNVHPFELLQLCYNKLVHGGWIGAELSAEISADSILSEVKNYYWSKYLIDYISTNEFQIVNPKYSFRFAFFEVREVLIEENLNVLKLWAYAVKSETPRLPGFWPTN